MVRRSHTLLLPLYRRGGKKQRGRYQNQETRLQVRSRALLRRVTLRPKHHKHCASFFSPYVLCTRSLQWLHAQFLLLYVAVLLFEAMSPVLLACR